MFWLWFWEALLTRRGEWAVEVADAGDADELAEIHAGAFARGWSVDEMEQLLRDRAVVACVLRREGRRQAFGFALSRMAEDEAEVLSIAVAAERRGSGGGKALLGRHLGRLAGLGVRRVVLEVDEDNDPALSLYLAYGFRQVGRRKAYYARADGKRGSARVMALDMA
ncbi:MAG: ribosomal-protein-alanine N-acetyltransferase RimI [Ancylobacter novellus]|uniref:Ribosomal-protein-alanine N-acetyltransferase RimI n=1 Tax=Ancylobacter novellus TaxID=921 RepID=A0A2W5K8U9_ANCNO|nr:MAG: ribosomal-protein-alanine N-acetyltransferase RimI [Ancylobacter novellus]